MLINTSRGSVVDQQAMVEALIRGRLAGLGLDVLDGEPQVPLELRGNDRVVLTAHSAFYSDEGLRELRVKAAGITRNLLLDQSDRNIVNDVRPPSVDRRAAAFCMELQS
jgi:D-3-phosphoglycerate dehydrogenase/C-terminal binding protein